MKLVIRDLPVPAGKSVKIVPLSDLHIGHPRHNPVIAQRYIDWVSASPDRFCVMVGDMTETALRDSYGEVYEQPLSPQKQAEEVVRVFGPIKDRILGCVSGNHEQRVTQRTSFDPSMIYASALGVPYDPASMVLAVTWAGMGGSGVNSGKDRKHYTLYFTHGWGAARTLGPRLSQPAKLRDVVANADVYITAHLHQPGEFPLDQYRIDIRNKRIVREQQRFVTCGSSLDHAEYAEQKGLAPTTMEFPIIELLPKNATNDHRNKVVVHSDVDGLAA